LVIYDLAGCAFEAVLAVGAADGGGGNAVVNAAAE